MGSLSSGLVLRGLLAASLIGPIVDLDWQVQRAVQSWRPAALETPMELASKAGRPQLVLGVLLAVAAFGGPAGAATARFAVVALIPTNAIVEATKRATNRARPDGEHRRSNASFPSSHAANAFALAWVLAWRWRPAAWGFYLLAAVVGFSRIFLNRHFASDVLIGAMIGVVCAWVVGTWMSRRGWIALAPPAGKTIS
jgi:membrane-associated phospholipid phosphatase